MTSARATLRLLTLALLALALSLALFYAPIEPAMGPAQKILYLHLPAAVDTFLAGFVVFLASLAFLATRSPRWDALACAAAEVTALYCTVVLLTGMIWARLAWGSWWAWSPRLTFSLVLWLLYLAYLVIRPAIAAPAARALAAAVYGVIAFLDVPLVYLSSKLLPDVHPASATLTAPMRLTLLVWFAPVTLAGAGLIARRYRALRNLADESAPAHGTLQEATHP